MRRLILIAILIFAMVGCQKEDDPSLPEQTEQLIEDNSLDTEIKNDLPRIEVYSDIERYQMTMSSVPGLPLIVNCYSADDEDLRLIITCDAGELIRWQNNGVVVVEGERYQTDFIDTVLYWRPSKGDSSEVQAELNFNCFLTGVEERMTVYLDSDGYYLK